MSTRLNSVRHSDVLARRTPPPVPIVGWDVQSVKGRHAEASACHQIPTLTLEILKRAMRPLFFRFLVGASVLLLGGVLLPIRAQSTPSSSDKELPGASFNEALRQRIEREFRAASRISPSLMIRFGGLKSSEIAGIDLGVLEYGQGSQFYPVAFYLSRDRRFLFFGSVIDLEVDRREQFLQLISLQDAHSRGKPNAPVTIVEFSDFQCPACAQAYSVVELVLKKYEGKVRLIFKHFPLVTIHDWAESAAIASECAALQKPDVFWNFHDVFFEEQDAITRENIDQKTERLIAETGLDRPAFKDCAERKRTIPRIARSMEEARSLGLKATPTFFVNGQQLIGDISFGAFKRLIDRELGLAEKRTQGLP